MPADARRCRYVLPPWGIVRALVARSTRARIVGTRATLRRPLFNTLSVGTTLVRATRTEYATRAGSARPTIGSPDPTVPPVLSQSNRICYESLLLFCRGYWAESQLNCQRCALLRY